MWYLSGIQTAYSVWKATPEVVDIAAQGAGDVIVTAVDNTKSFMDILYYGFVFLAGVVVVYLTSILFCKLRERLRVEAGARDMDMYVRRCGGRLKGGMRKPSTDETGVVQEKGNFGNLHRLFVRGSIST